MTDSILTLIFFGSCVSEYTYLEISFILGILRIQKEPKNKIVIRIRNNFSPLVAVYLREYSLILFI